MSELIKEVLRLHKEWIEDNTKGQRADFSGADLRWADLSETDLNGANLSKANLRGADLSKADLSGANLEEANLSNIKGQDIFNFTLGKDQGVYLNGNVTIGCKSFTLDHWLANFKSIGTEARYTDKEIVRYGAMLNLIKNL